MSVTTGQFKEIMETTPSGVLQNINTYLAQILKATNVAGTGITSYKPQSLTNQEPDYTGVTGMDNIAISKATPNNGIITFSFANNDISISISYRLN